MEKCIRAKAFRAESIFKMEFFFLAAIRYLFCVLLKTKKN